MVVVLDAVGSRRGGGLTVIETLAIESCRQRPSWQFVVLALPSAARYLSARVVPLNLRIVAVSGATSMLGRIVWQQCRSPLASRRLGADALVCFSNVGPVFSRTPVSVYLHQALLFFSEPSASLSRRERLQLAALRLFAFVGMLRAQNVICQTSVMAEAVKCRLSIPSERILLAPCTTPIVPVAEPEERVLAALLIARMRAVRGPVAMYVSYHGPHKNFKYLALAAAELSRRGIAGIFAVTVADQVETESRDGGRFLQLVSDANVHDRFLFLGPVPRSVVPLLLGAASLLVFPSLIESFPQPLIEAMASGVPLFVADRPYAREIVGEAGVYFDPTDNGESLVNAIVSHCSEQGLRVLSAASKRRGQAFVDQSAVASILSRLGGR